MKDWRALTKSPLRVKIVKLSRADSKSVSGTTGGGDTLGHHSSLAAFMQLYSLLQAITALLIS